MNSRSILALATSFLFACTLPTTSDATTDAASTAASTSTLDGTWDVTAVGTAPLGASQVTITGNSVVAVFVQPDEGTQVGDLCVLTKDRTTVTFTVTGDTMTGNVRDERLCPGEELDPSWPGNVITGSRTHDASAAAQTAYDGNWTVTADDGSSVAVEIASFVAQIWDSRTSKSGAPTVTYRAKNGVVSGDADDRGLTFAARKR